MARDFLHRPRSLLGHLSAENFHNARISARLRIHCTVCGTQGGVFYDYPDVFLRRAHGIGLLRETLACMACGASMRDRQMATGLLMLVEASSGRLFRDLAALRLDPAATLRILDTDSFSSLNRVLRGMPGYVHSQFRPAGRNGERLPDGSVNADLLDLPFPDGSFDVVMTSDVMEHVPEDQRAHREILRVLVTRGSYLFTVPYDPTLQGTRQLTCAAGGTERFVLEKHVHGDPHAASGILAHRIYGQQIFTDLRDIGYHPRFLVLDRPSDGIFGGDLFIATRET